MKHAILTTLLLGAAAIGVSAQESGKAVRVPGPAPRTNYVWMTLRGANAVDVRLTNGTLVRNFPTGAPTNFNQPWDIVGVTSLHRVFISNRGAVPGTVTVLDSDTLQFVALVQVPGSQLLQGMSVSEDESAVFVAGADANGPAVFHIDPATLTPAVRVGGITDPGRGASDCVVLRASNVGGAGSGPGKIYWSVRLPGTGGYIGITNFVGTSPVSISTGSGPLIAVENPDNMERTPDSRFVFVGCMKRIGIEPPAPPPPPRIIRIDVLTDSATMPAVGTAIQDLGHRVWDVTWRVDGTGGNRGFILLQVDAGGRDVVEINDAGTPIQPPVAADANGVTPSTLRFAPLSDQLFAGELFGTSNRYNYFSAPVAPPVAYTNFQLASGGDPFNFAVLSTPAIVISDITPRAGPDVAGTIATVHGAGFQPGLTAQVGATPVPVTFIDSNTMTVDFTGLGVGTFGLQINSPNLQTGSFDAFYRNYAAPAIRPLPTDPEAQLPLPSAAQGYRMVSYPQYATLTTLKAALTAQLGPYNPVVYRIFFYRQGAYVELNQVVDDGCDLAGESFWVLTRNGGMLTLTEPDVLNNNGGSPRVVPLSPGFNMISQPNFQGGGAVNWANVLVTLDETNFTGAVPVTTIPGQAIVGTAAVEYVNGAYVTADPLIAGRGYWVRNLQNVPAYLVFDPGVVFKPGSGSGSYAGGAPPPAGMNPPPPPSGMSTAGSGSGGCGLLGAECLLLGLLRAVFPRKGRHRRLAA